MRLLLSLVPLYSIYCNPDDARLVVNARVGMNSSFNMARRPARIIVGLCLALPLACPLFGVWSIGMERAPVRPETAEGKLTATHYGSGWSVVLADIRLAEPLKKLPGLRRVGGTGLVAAMTGRYSSSEWGSLPAA